VSGVGHACERVFVSSEPSILHADLDAFYASVEQRDDPSLRGRPVIVGGGVVLACSYEAKARGVRTAMGGRMARALCPDAVVVPPRMEAYSGASRAVFSVFSSVTPLVEPISIDEAFLDVAGLRRVAGSPPDIAARLRRAVADDVGLPITVGVAATKFLAKVASRVAKPDGLLVVPVGGELDFLHPLPVEVLWGVGEVTSRKLHGHGVTTVGDLAGIGGPTLESLLGRAAGRHLDALAHGRDPRRVQVGRRRRSVGAQRALGRDPISPERTDAVLIGLVDRVTRRMRRAGRTGRTVTLRLRFADFGRATRSHTLAAATDETDAVLAAIRLLATAAAPLIAERGLTMLGVAVGNLDDAGGAQLELPFAGDAHPHALDVAVDDVRERYGLSALTRATLLGRDQGLEMPMLPD
jgi:DNA polymerase IV